MQIQILADIPAGCEQVVTKEALSFLASLHVQFNDARLALLKKRIERQKEFDSGVLPDFLPETAAIRQDPSWKVAQAPVALEKRYVEITGPVDKKMMINALNSGADVFMADFEDALSPSWNNVVEGQLNVIHALDKSLTYTSNEGKKYQVHENTAHLMVRPRGWHLDEKHMHVNGAPISAAIFDFGLYFFHNAKSLMKKKEALCLYLPKLECHQEARLWNDIFCAAEKAFAIAPGSIRATVLIETIVAAFEMEEILYELKERVLGLNAGRWDYIFSIIKKFHEKKGFVFPDRAQITMTVPFMKAYTDLLIRTCHKRGAHAMGGMAAFVPSRRDPEINAVAMQRVKEDKEREVTEGFDGTWVAHPDLVVLAHDVFASFLHNRPHQKERMLETAVPSTKTLLDFTVPNGAITEDGVRQNISVCLQYIESWLRGQGAVALFNLMEDAATAEIARSQLWQWVHHSEARLPDNRIIDIAYFRACSARELEKIRLRFSQKQYQETQFARAHSILDRLVTSVDFIDFLTQLTYEEVV